MNTYKMTLEDSVDSMTFDLLEVPIVDKDVEGAVDNTTLDGNVFTDYLWLKKNYVQKWSILCDDEYSRLRGFYTRQFDNASVPTYKLFYGENISQDQVVSGDYILVDNTTERNAPITSFELLGDAEQDGTPTPDSPIPVNTVTGEQTVKIEGKNLINNSDLSYIYSNVPSANNTLTTIDTGIRYSTTHPSGSPLVVFKLLDATSYVGKTARMSANFGTGGSIVMLAVNSNGSSTTVLATGTTSGATISHTITSGDLSGHQYLAYALRLTVAQGTTADFTNLIMTIDNADMSFEPYQGQTLPVNLGKNLFDKSTATQNYRLGSTGEPFADSDYYLSDFISVAQNTACYISGTSGAPASSAICFYASDKSFISRRAFVNDWYTFTTPANTAFLRFTTLKTNSIDQVQLELGSQATSYSAYFTPIELAKIGDYQDKIYKTNGKWYIEKQVGKVVYDGTEAGWFAYSSNVYAGGARLTTIRESLCDYALFMPNVTTAGALEDKKYCWASEGNDYRPLFRRNDIADLATWKTWLGTHPTTVYYALATPTTTEITNSELVGQLEAILQAYLYTGTNNISNNAVSPNLAGQMNIGYKLIFSEETVLIEPTAVRLTLTDGGIINVCGCRQNVQLTMRETIQ